MLPACKPNMIFRVHKNLDLNNIRSCRVIADSFARAAHEEVVKDANGRHSLI